MVELNKHCCETLKTRLAYHYLMNDNNADTYNDYFKEKIDKDVAVKLDNPFVPIDNNRIENDIRSFIFGRKNWFFCE